MARGRRWRWQARFEGEVLKGSYASLTEAIEGLDQVLDEREAKRWRDSQRGSVLSIAELCERWFTAHQARFAPATAKQYGIHIRVHIGEIGKLDANTIKPRELQAFYDSLRWKPAKESHHILRRAFAWGLLNGDLWREGNPALVARPSRRACADHDGYYDEDGTIHPIDEKDIPLRTEVEKLLVDAESSNQTWWLYLKLASTTGARPGEICALQRQHLDLQRGTIRIEWTADRVGGRIKRPKTPWSIRTLLLPAEFLEAVAPSIPDDPQAYLFPSNTQPGASSPLPCWNSRSVKRRLDKALLRTGLPHYTPHAFRHFVATYLLESGCPSTQVARFLGHSNDSEIRRRYANHIVDHAQRAIGQRAAGAVSSSIPVGNGSEGRPYDARARGTAQAGPSPPRTSGG